MKNNGDLGQKWLKMAETEFAAAEALIEAGVALTGACFHCQQAAEKSVKAWLLAHDVEAPKTHKLEHLIELSTQTEPTLPRSRLSASTSTIRFATK